VFATDTKGNETQSDNTADFLTWVLGDINGDGSPNIADASFLINGIFSAARCPFR